MHSGCNELWQKQLHDLMTTIRECGVQVDDQAEERLLTYCVKVAAHASTHDLVSVRDVEHLVTKHVAASIGVLAVEAPRAGELWIDAGTGGGFPGMVVKICRPELQIALLDSSQKKTAFLRSTGKALGLDDLEVVCSRMEEPFTTRQTGVANRFDVILMRAVAPLTRVVNWASMLCRPGARLLVFKGSQWRQEVDESLVEIGRANWVMEDVTQIPWARPTILRFRMR